MTDTGRVADATGPSPFGSSPQAVSPAKAASVPRAARPHSRVLPLGGDGQTDTPRRPEFWLAQREFGVVEEWACWVMQNGRDPLSNLSLAGLRGLVQEHGRMMAEAAYKAGYANGASCFIGDSSEDLALASEQSWGMWSASGALAGGTGSAHEGIAAAPATEAGTAETRSDSVHEGAVPEGQAS